jgi:hypothetical protein
VRCASLRYTVIAADMTVPNADRAIIAREKLVGYLLNVSHKRGGPKARLLQSVGYRSAIRKRWSRTCAPSIFPSM